MTTHIENSDRGLTINKSLAWTIVTSLAAALFWYASTTQSMKSSIEQINSALASIEGARRADLVETKQLEGRVRVLENDSTKQAAQYEGLAKSIEELKLAQKETNELLRQLIRGSAAK